MARRRCVLCGIAGDVDLEKRMCCSTETDYGSAFPRPFLFQKRWGMMPGKIDENYNHLARRSRDPLPVRGIHPDGLSLIDRNISSPKSSNLIRAEASYSLTRYEQGLDCLPERYQKALRTTWVFLRVLSLLGRQEPGLISVFLQRPR